MKTISLDGWWDWRIPNGQSIKRCVPSCYTCVGKAVYETSLELASEPGMHTFLCFDGVSYMATPCFNGAELGRMLPYVSYEFDITPYLRAGSSVLEVTVDDMTAEFGPTGGWEDYGGISRSVRIELRRGLHVSKSQWLAELTENYTKCACTYHVWVANYTAASIPAEVTVRVSYNGTEICSGTQSLLAMPGESGLTFPFQLEKPVLWSCENPALYRVETEISTADFTEARSETAGIREFKAAGSQFYLNGKRTFLKGVARHEMWEGQGFTLTDEQIEQDLLLIKKMGANFVRLVHYPHSRETIETADRLGLMVSEEPGLWWSDMGNREITDKALEIMRRTVLRDRNSPSVVAWLFFNECELKKASRYLKEGAAMCRKLDPTRLVAGANCMANKEAKRVFDKCGFDFYTQHPYSYEPNDLINAMNVLQGKPLVFTEWGGWLIHNNPNLLKWFKSVISKYAHADAPNPCLAGMCWWQWQDIHEQMRGLPACENGLLSDGLVDGCRNRKPMYAVMAEFFDLIDRPLENGRKLEHTGSPLGENADAKYTPVPLPDRDSCGQPAAWESLIADRKRLQRTPVHRTWEFTGPVMPEAVEAASGIPAHIPQGRPLALAGGCDRIEIPVGLRASALHFFGHVTWFDGYPLRGLQGDVLARYLLVYDDKTTEEISLRNGWELASSSMHAYHSRMEPVALSAPHALTLTIDPDWEVYLVNRFTVKTDAAKMLVKVVFERLDREFCPLLYAITAEL